jgi:hypothetical protein
MRMQWLLDWIREHYIETTMIVGAIIFYACFQIRRFWLSAKLLLAIAAIALLTGVNGLAYNIPALTVTLMLIAINKGILLTPIQIIFRGLSVLLSLIAGAFLLYVLFANPDAILKNLWNPLMFLYFLPAVLFWSFAELAQEAKIQKLKINQVKPDRKETF